MKGFKPNSKFWKQYRKLRKQSKEEANVFLLICELAYPSGQTKATAEDLALLFSVRFNDPEENARQVGIYAKR